MFIYLKRVTFFLITWNVISIRFAKLHEARNTSSQWLFLCDFVAISLFIKSTAKTKRTFFLPRINSFSTVTHSKQSQCTEHKWGRKRKQFSRWQPRNMHRLTPRIINIWYFSFSTQRCTKLTCLWVNSSQKKKKSLLIALAVIFRLQISTDSNKFQSNEIT